MKKDLQSEFPPDCFLLYEECSVDAKIPVASLRQVFSPDRRSSIVRYHVVAVHPAAQTYIVTCLHKIVHLGLAPRGTARFLDYVIKKDLPVSYYPSSHGRIESDLLVILNGSMAQKCPSFEQLDFEKIYRLCEEVKPGPRGNSQLTYGVATQNNRRNTRSSIINAPTIKKSNVPDGILPEFSYMSNLLEEIDPTNKFHRPRQDLPPMIGSYAEKIVTKCRELSAEQKERSYIVGLSTILNNLGPASPSSRQSRGSRKTATESVKASNKLFRLLKIPSSDVIVKPHVDNGNGHLMGMQFLVGASVTVTLQNGSRRRLLFAGFMRKALEDAISRKRLTKQIMKRWTKANNEVAPSRMKPLSQEFVKSIWETRRTDSAGFCYRICHMNKCFFYSLIFSIFTKAFTKHRMSLTRRIECTNCLIQCNGPDKLFRFLEYVISLDELPDEALPVVCNDFMLQLKGGTLASNGKAIRHPTSMRTPMLVLSCLFGLRMMLQLVEQCNDGSLSYKQANLVIRKNVEKAGNLCSNHILSVFVLTGIIWRREFLTSCSLAPMLITNTKKRVLKLQKDTDAWRDITPLKVSTAIHTATKNFSKTMMFGDNMVCEFGKKPDKQAYDVHHPDQSFVYISGDSDGRDTIVEVHKSTGWEGRIFRTEKSDKAKFEKTFFQKSNVHDKGMSVKWWLPEPKADDFVIFYAKTTKRLARDPNTVLFPSVKAQQRMTREKIDDMLESFLKRHGVMTQRPSVRKAVSYLKSVEASTGKQPTLLNRRSTLRVARPLLLLQKRRVSENFDEANNEPSAKKPRKQSNVPLPPPPSYCSTVNLMRMATEAFRDKYDMHKPDYNTKIEYSPTGQMLWTASLSFSNGAELRETNDSLHGPSFLASFGVNLSSGSVGYPKKKQAEDALNLLIVTTVSTKRWRRKTMLAQMQDHVEVSIKNGRHIIYSLKKKTTGKGASKVAVFMEWECNSRRMF